MAEPRQTIELRIPLATLIKVALFALAVYAVVRLSTVFIMLFLAALIGVVIDAGASWLERHRVRRGFAIGTMAIAAFGVLTFFLLVIVPSIVTQTQQLIQELPRIANRVEHAIPAAGPYLDSISAELRSPPHPEKIEQWLTRGAVAGMYVIEGLTAVIMVVVLAIYLVVDGQRAFAWLVSFAPETQRPKLVRTADEIRPVMLAYMRGQLITSSASAATALSVLLPLHVPAAVPLAMLWFVGDFVPVVGFIISIVPSMLVALIVSPAAALIVGGAHVLYQLFENYVLAPRVYGRAMRLSTLTVLLSITFGGVLMGPIGAIIVLPIAAAYPSIERIWLEKHLPEDTVEKHEAIASDSAEESDAATDELLQD